MMTPAQAAATLAALREAYRALGSTTNKLAHESCRTADAVLDAVQEAKRTIQTQILELERLEGQGVRFSILEGQGVRSSSIGPARLELADALALARRLAKNGSRGQIFVHLSATAAKIEVAVFRDGLIVANAHGTAHGIATEIAK